MSRSFCHQRNSFRLRDIAILISCHKQEEEDQLGIQSCAKQIAKIGSLRAINFTVFVYFRQIFKYVANIFRMMPLWPREITIILRDSLPQYYMTVYHNIFWMVLLWPWEGVRGFPGCLSLGTSRGRGKRLSFLISPSIRILYYMPPTKTHTQNTNTKTKTQTQNTNTGGWAFSYPPLWGPHITCHQLKHTGDLSIKKQRGFSYLF